MKPAHLPTETVPGQITWRCASCRRSTRTGALHIDLQKVRQAERALADWERNRGEPGARAFDVSEILMMPRVESWRVDCNTCCHECVGCYTIELVQCQSVYALIRWTEHLYDKNWFRSTNWVSFIAEVAREHGSPLEPTGVR